MIRTNSVLHLLLLLGVAISGIGCKEHKRLEAETASIKAKFLEIRPQVQKNLDEIAQCNTERTTFMNERRAKRSADTPSKEELEAEVSALQAEKLQLEKDVKEIEEAYLRYQKENL